MSRGTKSVNCFLHSGNQLGRKRLQISSASPIAKSHIATGTGEVGVHPSNCSNESHNLHATKGPKGVVQPNALLEASMTDSLPKLVSHDALKRQDPCTIEMPTGCSPLMAAVTLFLTEVWTCCNWLDNDHWVCNLQFNVGVPLCNERPQNIVLADEPFQRNEVDKSVICRRLALTTRHSCKLRRESNGKIVGDCVNCIKKVGFLCPGAAHLRSECDMFGDQSPESRCKFANQ